MTQNVIGERLAAARKAKNYTQEDIAQFLNCGRATITNYENGRRSPDLDTLVKLADKYEVSTDYLFGRSEAWTTDNELKFVCDYTGLSESFIGDFLYEGLSIKKYLLSFLNSIGNSETLSGYFESMMFYLDDYITAVKEIQANKEKFETETFETLDEVIFDNLSAAEKDIIISRYKLECIFRKIIQEYSGENQIDYIIDFFA